MQYTIMTPGPTDVRENVMLSRAEKCTNPDLDIKFYDFYKETCDKLGKLLNTKNRVRILSGEGILGLEAACASLTENNDRVLVIDNGIYGEGFKDFVNMYGGNPILFKGDRGKAIDINELEDFLNKDSDFKYATVVHCDTPSGVLNNIKEICKLLKSKGILTVVDTVYDMIGEEVKVDEWGIDIALGGSQKALSAPPGLSIVTISDDAINIIKNRKQPIAGFYCNLLIWEDYYENKWFPYTMPISDIKGLATAIDNILDEGIENVINRHSNIANAVRKSIIDGGLELNIIESDNSNTVTVVKIPENICCNKLLNTLREKYNVFIAGSFGYLEGKVLRIGHMGESAKIDKVAYTLLSLEMALKELGFQCKVDLSKTFLSYLH